MEYLTQEGLCIFASEDGRLLYMDKRTGEKTCIDFVRICIEGDVVHDQLVREFIVRDPEWNDFGIFVKY